LLHLASLPGGRLGPEAEAFVDWLAAAGQSWWQILPLVPPDGFGSPYNSASAFAAWPGLLAEPGAEVTAAELEAFRERNRYWIADWERFAGDGAAADQVRFEREWGRLRRYALQRGVRIIGDLPIYVSGGGVDFHAHPELFGGPEVAGAPPDALNPHGQLWGNPLYRWPANRAEGYRWWIERFRRSFELVDLTRIDHFRGFVSCWVVPPEAETAEHGHWRRGPGEELFEAIESELGRLPIVVEDLGVITPAVYRLRDRLGAPGMRILEFAFGTGPWSVHALANHPQHCVLYTGTHDLDPVAAWWDAAPEGVRRRARTQMAAAGIDEDGAWGLIRLASSSRASLVIVQAQDILGLGREARLNTPGTVEGNWRWRLEPGALTPALAARLREAAEKTGRLPTP